MSTSKTLSHSTLSLRFMQNARKNQNGPKVELQKAEVKDDGQWEVSQEVRDAWGLTFGSSSREADNIHEDSYLPFLFSSSTEDSESSTRPVGRRVFGKKGKEIVNETSEEPPAESDQQPSEVKETSTKGRKIHPRPVTIAASGKSGFLRGFDELEDPQTKPKTAKQAIFESGGVGVDIRSARTTQKESLESTNQFVKPAGVDEPQKKKKEKSSNAIIEGAREKKAKRKRPKDSEAEGTTKRQKNGDKS